MSQLSEIFNQPAPPNKKLNYIFGGLAIAAVASIFIAPGAIRSYHDAEAIEHKRGPVAAYVTKTIGELALDGQRLDQFVGKHSCDSDVSYALGADPRHCGVEGHVSYVIKAKEFSDAYHVGREELNEHHLPTGTRTITYEGQNIDVDVDFQVKSAAAYNGSFDQRSTSPEIPQDSYIVEFDAHAWSVNRN